MKIIRREISQEELERAKQWKGPGHNAKVSVQKLEDGASQAGSTDAKKTANEGWDGKAESIKTLQNISTQSIKDGEVRDIRRIIEKTAGHKESCLCVITLYIA